MVFSSSRQPPTSTGNSALVLPPDIPSPYLGLDDDLVHPLDRPLASFHNHSGIKAPIGGPRRPLSGSTFGKAGSTPNGDNGQENESLRSDEEESVADTQPERTALKDDRTASEEQRGAMAGSPRINPFHLLSHPSDDYNHHRPILPQAGNSPLTAEHTSADSSLSTTTTLNTPYLTSGSDVEVVNVSMTSTTVPNSIAPVHITRVSKDTVVVVPATDEAGEPVTPRSRFMEKVGGRFRRKASAANGFVTPSLTSPAAQQIKGDANVPPPAPFRSVHDGLNIRRDGGAMMQNAPNSVGEAPPSPPISEEEHESEEAGVLREEEERDDDDEEEEEEEEEGSRGRNSKEGATSSRVLQSRPDGPTAIVLGRPILDSEERKPSYTEEPEPMSAIEETAPPNALSFSTAPDSPIVARRPSTSSSLATSAYSHMSPTGLGILTGGPPPPIPPGPTRAGSLAAANIRRKQSIEAGLSTSQSPARGVVSSDNSITADEDPLAPAPLESPLTVSPKTIVDPWGTPARAATSGVSIPEGGYLHPSSASIVSNSSSSPSHSMPSPIRRNTTGTAGKGSPLLASRSPLLQARSYMEVPTTDAGRAMTAVPGVDGAALDSDILAEADKLRKERLDRRQKQRQGSAADEPSLELPGMKKRSPSGTSWRTQEVAGPAGVAGTPVGGPQQGIGMGSPSIFQQGQIGISGQKRRMSEKGDRHPGTVEKENVLVGNLIGEDHVNYVLMYNMLTGIRIGVSRCQAKIKRPLTEEDYTARHKFSFDVVGNELTPSARYDFKFKDYAPWVFRELRDDHFHLDPADYLLSLTAKYILSELGSPGKSGSFFYFSRDYRFIIKTIHHSEHKFLRRILKDYHNHVKSNPHTLLSRFYGLHRVKLPRGRKIHFVIMNNLFPPHRDIHETYDLKGSAYGREYPEDQLKENSKVTLKDLNWVHRGRMFELGPEKRALFAEQLRRDMEFLKKMKVMDYSLLIGLHNMERGNRDNIRENQLTVFHPDVNGLIRRKPSSVKGGHDASAVRKAIRRSDPKALGSATQQLPNSDSADRRHFLFYQDEGGLRATDEANQPMDLIYYLGVIDILTPYNTAKRLEHFWKGMTEDLHMISCVPPDEYGERFLNFLLSFMRGADKSVRPKME